MTELTAEQKADAKARIEAVQKFMTEQEIELVAYPKFIHMDQGVFGTIAEVQFADVKYASKPSPFIK